MYKFPVWCEIPCGTCADVICGVWASGRIPYRVLRSEALQARAVYDEHTDSWTCRYCEAESGLAQPAYRLDEDEDLKTRFKVIWNYGHTLKEDG
jgi:hypothetical protein